MKKNILLIFILSSFFLQAQKKIIQLDSIGLPEYRKLFSANRAFPIYKQNNHLFITIAPLHLYNYCNISKKTTFEVYLGKKGELQKIEPITQVSEFTIGYDSKNARLILQSNTNQSEISFDVAYQKEKKHIIYTPLDSNCYIIDSTLGFIIFRNRFIKYAKLPGLECNVALLDKNKNGITDSEDLLCISQNNYFFTAVNSHTCKVKNQLNMKIFNHCYQVDVLSGGDLAIEKRNIQNNISLSYDIVYSNYMKNIQFENEINTSLMDILSKEKYTIINIWSVYCPPCISSLDVFNQDNLKDNVIGLTIENQQLVNQFNTKFNNFQINKTQLNELNVEQKLR